MIDFPASPSVGDQFTLGGTTWEWDGTKWTIVPGTSGPPVIISDTPPASPVVGDLWWDSIGGQLYCWVVDPTSSQWVVATNNSAAMQGYLPLTGGVLSGPLTGQAATFSGMLTGVNATLTGTLVASGGGTLGGAWTFSNNVTVNGATTLASLTTNAATFNNGLAIEGGLPGGPYLNYGLSFDGPGLHGAWIALNAAPQGTANNGGMGVVSFIGTIPRWEMDLGNGVAESGSNAGSNFGLVSYDDTGASLDTPFQITRSTSAAMFSGDVNVGGALNATYGVNTSGLYASGLATATSVIDVGGGLPQATGGPWWFHATPGNDCFVTFLIDGSFGTNFGLNANGHFYQGGWSDGPVYTQFWTSADFANPACDYRIKADVAPLASTWDHVKALRPIRYRQKEFSFQELPAPTQRSETNVPLIEGDERERWGFIAHELQETLGETAATVSKDHPDRLQSPNLMALVAALTRTVQELQARVEELEARP
jgi:Chaperone of endosialidase